MKSYELTVNDYVLGKNDTIIRICAVHLKKVGYHHVSSRIDWVRLDQIKPIPLTTKILEKLGFKEDVDGDYDMVVDNVHYTIRYLDVDHTYLWLGVLTVRYVHELQHFLTYCGLSIKELERD